MRTSEGMASETRSPDPNTPDHKRTVPAHRLPPVLAALPNAPPDGSIRPVLVGGVVVDLAVLPNGATTIVIGQIPPMSIQSTLLQQEGALEPARADTRKGRRMRVSPTVARLRHQMPPAEPFGVVWGIPYLKHTSHCDNPCSLDGS